MVLFFVAFYSIFYSNLMNKIISHYNLLTMIIDNFISKKLPSEFYECFLNISNARLDL
jgi:hypothetical protein